jgi:hypothetical protein
LGSVKDKLLDKIVNNLSQQRIEELVDLVKTLTVASLIDMTYNLEDKFNIALRQIDNIFNLPTISDVLDLKIDDLINFLQTSTDFFVKNPQCVDFLQNDQIKKECVKKLIEG